MIDEPTAKAIEARGKAIAETAQFGGKVVDVAVAVERWIDEVLGTGRGGEGAV